MTLIDQFVWKEIETPLGKRLGFSLYKKWWQFWK